MEPLQRLFRMSSRSRSLAGADAGQTGHRLVTGHRSPGTDTDRNRSTNCDGGLRSVVGMSSPCMSGKRKNKMTRDEGPSTYYVAIEGEGVGFYRCNHGITRTGRGFRRSATLHNQCRLIRLWNDRVTCRSAVGNSRISSRVRAGEQPRHL